MMIAAVVLAVLAAAVHVYIFLLESLWWTKPRTRAIFKLNTAEAGATKPLAFNQGFYNLFLALAVVIGTALVVAGESIIGHTLILTGVISMFLAALVLVLSDRTRLKPATSQGIFPLLSLLLYAAASLS